MKQFDDVVMQLLAMPGLEKIQAIDHTIFGPPAELGVESCFRLWLSGKRASDSFDATVRIPANHVTDDDPKGMACAVFAGCKSVDSIADVFQGKRVIRTTDSFAFHRQVCGFVPRVRHHNVDQAHRRIKVCTIRLRFAEQLHFRHGVKSILGVDHLPSQNVRDGILVAAA